MWGATKYCFAQSNFFSISTHAPCGTQRYLVGNPITYSAFQLTRPMRGATCPGKNYPLNELISTHAPHAGRNIAAAVLNAAVTFYFNSRAPCGAQRTTCAKTTLGGLFQLTRPVRGATDGVFQSVPDRDNFNSRAPCGAQLTPNELTRGLNKNFNSRAPCGAQRNVVWNFLHCLLFQLTRPMRGATNRFPISIIPVSNFNSRAPCGAQPNLLAIFFV